MVHSVGRGCGGGLESNKSSFTESTATHMHGLRFATRDAYTYSTIEGNTQTLKSNVLDETDAAIEIPVSLCIDGVRLVCVQIT